MAYGSSLGPKDYEKKSKLAQAKGVGSSYRGSHEWLVSRIQAVLSVPFTLYVLVSLLIFGNAADYSLFIKWLSNPINTSCLIIAIVTLCWHGAYGVITVINDYVHNRAINFFAILGVRLFFGFVVVICVVSILMAAIF